MKSGGKKKKVFSIRLNIVKHGDKYDSSIYYLMGKHPVNTLYGVDSGVLREAKIFSQLLRYLYQPESGTETVLDGCLVRLNKADFETTKGFKCAMLNAADICRLTLIEKISC